MRSKLPRAGFDELGIDWGPASPFGSDDDPGTPMTHQDSSESDELRPDLFAPGAAPLPAPEPVVTPAANAQPERPIAPFVRTLYALLEGPYDETLCEWLCGNQRVRRRRVDGVEDNVMIQRERAVKFLICTQASGPRTAAASCSRTRRSSPRPVWK